MSIPKGQIFHLTKEKKEFSSSFWDFPRFEIDASVIRYEGVFHFHASNVCVSLGLGEGGECRGLSLPFSSLPNEGNFSFIIQIFKCSYVEPQHWVNI